jgi:intergrase/recombinase
MMSWRLSTSKWTLRRGERAVLHFESAEPIRGKPVVTVNQRGIARYALAVKRISKYKFRAAFRPRSGGRGGEMAILIRGTDRRDGAQRRVFTLKLR